MKGKDWTCCTSRESSADGQGADLFILNGDIRFSIVQKAVLNSPSAP